MKILFISLGCDKNLVDSEVMLGLLNQAGYTFTDDEWEVLKGISPLEEIIIPLSPIDACNEFLGTFHEIVCFQRKNDA